MVNVVGNIGSTGGGSSVRPVAPAVPVASAVESTVTKATASPVKPISPIIRQDSVSGVLITQYLNNEGQVKAQFPSNVAVAYLRVGLTETGELRKDKSHSEAADKQPPVLA